jgi:DNA-binding FrmR family transcriptional regulator
MSHTQQDQAKLLARVRRLTGQMQALERALLAQAPCADVLQQLASIRGALNGVVSENGKNRTLRERSAFREGATR